MKHIKFYDKIRDGSRATARSKMESFVVVVNGWKPLTIITKRSILDVAAALDPPLKIKYPLWQDVTFGSIRLLREEKYTSNSYLSTFLIRWILKLLSNS